MSQSQNIKEYLERRLDFYLDLLRQMVEINSFTANEAGVNTLGELTASTFSELGFKAEFVQAANQDYGKHLFLFREGRSSPDGKTPPSVGMISHLDTVFSSEEEDAYDFNWRESGDRIYGPGSVDIKGGTVMCYMVLDAIRTIEPDLFNRVSWLVCLDACEETLSLDFSQRCMERLPQKTVACLVFEGGNEKNGNLSLVTSRKGRASYRVSVTGRSAHAGNGHKNGANAIVQMAHTIQKIASMTDYEKDLTFNVGVVSGGSVVNRVPHHCEAQVEMRVFTPEYFDDGVAAILALDGTSDSGSQDGYPCSVAIEMVDQMAPWPRNEDTLSLLEIWRTTGQTIGIGIIEEARGGLSDGNPLSNYYPTIDGLGPVGANAHCSERTEDGSKDQEYVTVSSFVPKALLNTLSIINLIGEGDS